MDSLDQKIKTPEQKLFPKELVEEAKKRIMTYQEYVSEGIHTFPNYFELEGKGKKIFFYEAEHTNDPKHIELDQISYHMDRFTPDIVFIEGILRINSERLKNESLLECSKQGENIFTIKLALDKNIDFFCPEPDDNDQIMHLKSKGISDGDIITYYAFRNFHPGLRKFSKRSTVEAVQGNIEWLKRESSQFFSESFLSYEHVDEIIFQLTNKHIQNHTDDELAYITRPFPRSDQDPFKAIQNVSNLKGLFRDEYIVEKIAETLEKNNRLFIVYGGSHGIVQKPALEYLLKE